MKDIEKDCAPRLDSALQSLRREFTELPSASVESNLRREFRRHQTKRRAYRSLWWVASGVAVATAAMIILLRFSEPERKPAPVQTRVRQTQIEKPSAAPALIAVAKPVKVTRTRKRVRAAHPRVQTAQEVDRSDEFIPIPYTGSLSPGQQFDVYRVEMPRAIVARFGLPMSAGSFDSVATADVVVGNDGVARAIRFVH